MNVDQLISNFATMSDNDKYGLDMVIKKLSLDGTDVFVRFVKPNREILDEYIIFSELLEYMLMCSIKNYDYDTAVEIFSVCEEYMDKSVFGRNEFKYAFKNNQFDFCNLFKLEFESVEELMEDALRTDSIAKADIILSQKDCKPIHLVKYALIALETRKFNILRFIRTKLGVLQMADLESKFDNFLRLTVTESQENTAEYQEISFETSREIHDLSRLLRNLLSEIINSY